MEGLEEGLKRRKRTEEAGLRGREGAEVANFGVGLTGRKWTGGEVRGGADRRGRGWRGGAERKGWE